MSEFSKIELNKRLRSNEDTNNLITDKEKKDNGIMDGKKNTRDFIVTTYNKYNSNKNRMEALRKFGFDPKKRKKIDAAIQIKKK